MTAACTLFGELTAEEFLRDYWQKKPLLIRNAFPDFEPPVAADEVAGLACEADVESRLIIQSPDGKEWKLKHGPFSEESFSDLPDSHWTLLVQAVDHWVPQASELIEQFRFAPNWRIDDLMISYAADGGGVGPHYDNYDVFLIQAEGQRRWEVGGIFDEFSPRRENTPVMILPEWKEEQSWVLNPGDMLYLPPRVGHNGVAVGDGCMTYSVGFRAPSHEEILRGLVEELSGKLKNEDRYQDPDLEIQSNPGEISPKAIAQIRSITEEYLCNDSFLSDWFGRYMTEPKYPDLEQVPEDEISLEQIQGVLEEGDLLLTRNEGSRFSYYQLADDKVILFADGNSFECEGATCALATGLCQNVNIVINQGDWSDQALQILVSLFNQGSVYCE